MTQEEIKAYYEDVHNLKLEIKEGKLHYSGSLDLRNTQITSLPDNLTVGGYLDLRGTQITDKTKVKRNINENSFFEWKNRTYVKVDGIFTKVLSEKEMFSKYSKSARKRKLT